MPRSFRIALALAATSAGFMAMPAAAEVCRTETIEGTRYTICDVDPADPGLRLFWQNADGQAYRSFTTLATTLEKDGKKLVFAMNAGMYGTDFSPMGLYVEDGREIRPADRSAPPKGKGPVPNFYKKPNGIFFLDKGKAGILPTDIFLKRKPPATFATQSGPMLVIDGKINPIFIAGSSDRTRRSGVGICKGGDGQPNPILRFSISEDAVNFHDFARLFRDHLSCRNALFLDGGNGAGLFNPGMKRADWSWHGGFGPMVGLVAE